MTKEMLEFRPGVHTKELSCIKCDLSVSVIITKDLLKINTKLTLNVLLLLRIIPNALMSLHDEVMMPRMTPTHILDGSPARWGQPQLCRGRLKPGGGRSEHAGDAS